ncbi:MAG: hypothetical protein WC144_07790 [Sulfurimonas sp.]|jgi:multidrug efflux pump subunit AcrB|nr:hypothetical protein [Sulfurimonadaceae bacterium]
MDDFKLKVAIAVLSSLIFSFIFIAITFAMPLKKEQREQSKTTQQKQVNTTELKQELGKRFGSGD